MADTWPVENTTYDDAILRVARKRVPQPASRPALSFGTFGAGPQPTRITTSTLSSFVDNLSAGLFGGPSLGYPTGKPAQGSAVAYDDAIMRAARAKSSDGSKPAALAGLGELTRSIFARMGAASVPASETPPPQVHRASWFGGDDPQGNDGTLRMLMLIGLGVGIWALASKR